MSSSSSAAAAAAAAAAASEAAADRLGAVDVVMEPDVFKLLKTFIDACKANHAIDDDSFAHRTAISLLSNS